MRWYVMHSKPRKENFLFEQLRYHNIEVYNPFLLHTKSQAKNSIGKPFFPGYLFVHVDMESQGLSNLKWIPGSVGIVCFGGEPAYLPDILITLIKEKVNMLNSSTKESCPRYRKGDMVVIATGPLEGYRGIVDEYLPGKERVRILLKTLSERALLTEIPLWQLAD